MNTKICIAGLNRRAGYATDRVRTCIKQFHQRIMLLKVINGNIVTFSVNSAMNTLEQYRNLGRMVQESEFSHTRAPNLNGNRTQNI